MTKQVEHQHQKALFKWANQVPGLHVMYAIPNGGQRHVLVAKKMKAEGVKSGVPDIFLPIMRGVFGGLYIELKAPKTGKVSDNQNQWLSALRDEGYQVAVCFGWESAKETIENYLRLKLTKQKKKLNKI